VSEKKKRPFGDDPPPMGFLADGTFVGTMPGEPLYDTTPRIIGNYDEMLEEPVDPYASFAERLRALGMGEEEVEKAVSLAKRAKSDR